MFPLKNVRPQQMACGYTCLLLTEDATWERFPEFAGQVVNRLRGQVVDVVDGPDVRLWRIRVDGQRFLLVFDDFPLGITLEPETDEAAAAIESIKARLS